MAFRNTHSLSLSGNYFSVTIMEINHDHVYIPPISLEVFFFFFFLTGRHYSAPFNGFPLQISPPSRGIAGISDIENNISTYN